ncbi:NAD-dependent epimerase/dehydratase family protein, partial [Acidobacteria bacterium ACD]|nr:NAD-dependent epimerase/dehydratase family protein [Acidobacteria bacterium ACD]
MKLLVTGGTGFVGRRFCTLLHARGHEAVVLSRVPSRRPDGLPASARLEAWDPGALGRLLGGADSARSLHRLGAVSTVAYAALHLGSLIAPLWQRRGQYRDEAGRFRLGRFFALVFGPESPLPNPRDLRSFWAHAKWLFGRGPEPKFERYRYWEKLDYLALFLGISVIAASGFVMWAPELALLVLPGSWVNLAQIIHNEQALLVLVTILSAHVCHLVPRVFAPQSPSGSRAR